MCRDERRWGFDRAGEGQWVWRRAGNGVILVLRGRSSGGVPRTPVTAFDVEQESERERRARVGRRERGVWSYFIEEKGGRPEVGRGLQGCH
jgi:hypothetical protein